MDDVEIVREKTDVVSLIGETVALKSAGKNLKGLCPFHSEKTPSFIVSPERQIWHCYGCNLGGDVFSFLMQQEHVEFIEALRILAKRAGVVLRQSPIATGIAAKKERLYEANLFAAEFYYYLLTKHRSGETARSYLSLRKINPKVAKTFKLGFAPSQRDALTNYLIQKKKYTPEELIEGGLSIRGRFGLADFFWNRLMFPLYDHRDNIVGFAGRLLEASENSPKYINTKDTIIYHKGQTFFGIQITKESIRKHKQAILVEGEFDAITCFQAGITNVVAIKGTALTEQQAILLSRYAQRVTICFDGDHAGREAMKRSIPLLEKKNLQTTVVLIPQGKDPDESIKTNESEFKQALKHEISVYDYLFDQAVSSADPTSAQGKKEIADNFLPVLTDIANPIVREHYLKKLSMRLDTSYESILKELDRTNKPAIVKSDTSISQKKIPREEILEEYLLSLIVQSEDPREAVDQSVELLSGAMNKDRAYQKILYHLLDFFHQSTKQADPNAISQFLPSELLFFYNKSLLFPLPKLSPQTHMVEVRKTAVKLRDFYLREKSQQLSSELRKKEQEGATEEVSQLEAAFDAVTKLLKQGTS